MRRPPDMQSSIANSSATRVGGLYSASELPITQIIGAFVRRVSAAAIRFGDGIKSIAVLMVFVAADAVEADFARVFEFVEILVIVFVHARAVEQIASRCRPTPTDASRGNRREDPCKASDGTRGSSWRAHVAESRHGRGLIGPVQLDAAREVVDGHSRWSRNRHGFVVGCRAPRVRASWRSAAAMSSSTIRRTKRARAKRKRRARAYGVETLVVRGDVANDADCRRLAAAADEKWGTHRRAREQRRHDEVLRTQRSRGARANRTSWTSTRSTPSAPFR